MAKIVAAPKTLNIQLVTAGAKKSVKTAPTGLHRFDFDVMRQAHGGHLQHLESISLSCLHGEHELTQSQLLVMQSAIIHLAVLAITRTVCIICDNCHMIILCWPCLHVTIYNTCRSTGCFTVYFLLGAMCWLSCKSAAKEVHLQI